jgi:hypothetical protein
MFLQQVRKLFASPSSKIQEGFPPNASQFRVQDILRRVFDFGEIPAFEIGGNSVTVSRQFFIELALKGQE